MPDPWSPEHVMVVHPYVPPAPVPNDSVAAILRLVEEMGANKLVAFRVNGKHTEGQTILVPFKIGDSQE